MRLVYLDEAGLSNPAHEPFVVVAGIIIHADEKLVIVEEHLDSLVRQYIPDEHQDSFIFHATELFNGGGKVFIRERWPLENRLKIADELSNTFKVLQLPIALSWMERAKFPLTFELPEDTPTHHKTVAAHVVAFTQCAMTIELWMRQNTANEVCLLIAEDNQNARKLIKETQSHHQDKSIIQTLTEKEKQFFPYTKIKEDPLFQSKKRSSPLQLADYCAYVFKRFLMKDSRYDRFLDPMRGQFVVVDDSSAGQSP